MPQNRETLHGIAKIQEKDFSRMFQEMQPQANECIQAMSRLIEKTSTAIPVDAEAVANLLAGIPTAPLGERQNFWSAFLERESPDHLQMWSTLMLYLNRMQGHQAFRRHLNIVVQVLMFVVIRNEDENQLREGIEKLLSCIESEHEMKAALSVSAIRTGVAEATEIAVPRRKIPPQQPPHDPPSREEPKKDPQWKGPLQSPNHPTESGFYV